MILEVGREILESLGHRVVTAGSGEEAVEQLRKNRDTIDLVILDMIMPGMGGREVFDQLKNINMGVRVLLSSGYSINGQAQDILDKGCVGFIQKPFSIKQLQKKLGEIQYR